MIAGGGGLWIGAFFLPLFPHSGDPDGPLWSSSIGRLGFGLAQIWIFAFGLFALATLRADVLPSWGAWLVIVAALLGVVGLALFALGMQSAKGGGIASSEGSKKSRSTVALQLPFVVGIIASSILALGLIGWGYAL